jgi:nitrite reductase (NADH) small subunit
MAVDDTARSTDLSWTDVCAERDLRVGAGVVALVEGEQVAIFLTTDRSVHALSNRDPFSGSQVLGRGLLGERNGQPYVASPLLKQRFDLATGECLDDPAVQVDVFQVAVVDGRVRVGRTG